MSSRLNIVAGAVAAAALGLAAVPVAAQPPTSGHSCFWVTQWQGWKSPQPDVLYLGVGMHDVYRVQLTGGSSLLSWPDARLISKVRGSSSICNALDLDLEVSDGHGFAEPLIARSLDKMTPEEVAAIPPKFRPN